jgi:hypothetical protein
MESQGSTHSAWKDFNAGSFCGATTVMPSDFHGLEIAEDSYYGYNGEQQVSIENTGYATPRLYMISSPSNLTSNDLPGNPLSTSDSSVHVSRPELTRLSARKVNTSNLLPQRISNHAQHTRRRSSRRSTL